jgi:hypothetical protein
MYLFYRLLNCKSCLRLNIGYAYKLEYSYMTNGKHVTQIRINVLFIKYYALTNPAYSILQLYTFHNTEKKVAKICISLFNPCLPTNHSAITTDDISVHRSKQIRSKHGRIQMIINTEITL